jgi:hypothetical protein
MTRREWYDFERMGPCDVCGKRVRRQAHHAVREQDVKREAPKRIYDVANRMLVGHSCGCHPGHSQYGVNDTRIAYAKIPVEAKAFAVEILGEGKALNHFRRYYRDAP